MKSILTSLIALVIFSIAGFSQTNTDKKYDYAFWSLKDEKYKIFVTRKGDKQPLELAEGIYSSLSPDGRKVAYTVSYDSIKKYYINIIDINTREITEMTKMYDSIDSYGAVWSPDGNYLAFNAYKNDEGFIGVVNKENKDFKILTVEKSASIPNNLFSPSWTNDSKQIVAHNMSKIFLIDLQGNINTTYNIGKTFLNADVDISSDTKFMLLPDKENLIFNGFTGEHMDSEFGSLYIFNIKSNTIRRISPKNIDCFEPFLTADNKILFAGQKRKNSSGINVFELDLKSSKVKELFKDAREPSARLL